MKIKTGEFYMYKKSIEWFRIGVIHTGWYRKDFAICEHRFYNENLTIEYLEDQIKSGKLIKIPQVFK